ncbi:hypothetical protein Efla_001314 [Eimeria flavescens]
MPNSPNRGLPAACSPCLRLPSPRSLRGTRACPEGTSPRLPALSAAASIGRQLSLRAFFDKQTKDSNTHSVITPLFSSDGLPLSVSSSKLPSFVFFLAAAWCSKKPQCISAGSTWCEAFFFTANLTREEERKKRGQNKKEMGFFQSPKFEAGSYQSELSEASPGAAEETEAGSLSLGWDYEDSALSHSAAGGLDGEEVEQTKEGTLSPGTEGASADEGSLQARESGPLGGRNVRPERVFLSLAVLALAAVLLLGGRRLIAAAAKKYPLVLAGEPWVVEKFPFDGDEGRKQLAKEISRFAAAWDGSSERVQSAFLKHYSPAGQFCKASSSALSSLRLQAAQIGKNRPAADASPKQKQRDALTVRVVTGILQAATARLEGLAAIESHVEKTKCGSLMLDIPPGEVLPLTKAESEDRVSLVDLAAMLHPEIQIQRSDELEKMPRVVATRVAAKLRMQGLQLEADKRVHLAVDNALYPFFSDWVSVSRLGDQVNSTEVNNATEFLLRWMKILQDVKQLGELRAVKLSKLTQQPLKMADLLNAGNYASAFRKLELDEREVLEEASQMKGKYFELFRLKEAEGQEPSSLDELFASGVSFI